MTEVSTQFCLLTAGQTRRNQQSCLAKLQEEVAKSLGFRKVEEFDYLGVHLAMRKLIRADFDELKS